MKHYILRIKIVFVAMLLCLAVCVSAQAGDSIELAGDVLMIVLPATAAGLTIGFKDSEGTLQFAKSAALTLGATYGLKYAVNENRPNGSRHSFPSFHSSISFASAEFMRRRYGWEYGIPAYTAALFTAYSRVEARQHHTHDVIAGAAIGIAASYMFTRPYEGWHIQAGADSGYYGIMMGRNW